MYKTSNLRRRIHYSLFIIVEKTTVLEQYEYNTLSTVISTVLYNILNYCYTVRLDNGGEHYFYVPVTGDF